ncbi:baseplate J/gp47 family protein [Paraburkholderia sp. BR14263]|uniref:baseplate J/gp47 family protein n=1 Tax=unclassified Paraburkholderia TaxID=2615204 RepID=UPI0034CED2C3
MPFARPTLTQLRNQVAQDLNANLTGADALLRFSNLRVLGEVLAALAQMQYGYTDWVAKQSNPFTATDEYLDAWAALKNVLRKAATQAGAETPGQVTFPATNGVVLPAGSSITRGDGVGYTTSADATAANGAVTVNAVANEDPTGLTGAFGNCVAGTVMTLGTAIAGITSTGLVTTAFTGGADIETDDSLRSRMLFAYQNPPQGGAVKDYITWALQVAGVTRAWCNPNGFGPGTVVVYAMLDSAESGNGGFPVGTDGVAANESRGIAATGDQLTIANWIYPLRPATALVYVCSPTRKVVDFTITGSGTFSAATKALIAAAISGVFVMYGDPLGSEDLGGGIDLSYIGSAIAAISGTAGFVITSPAGNIVGTTGQLPVLGDITWLP